jgi:hypothetical protein
VRDHKTEVKLHVEQTEPDGLSYMECPECGEAGKVMVVPLDGGGYFYRCLRASCALVPGTIGSTFIRTQDMDHAPKKPSRRTYCHYQAVHDYVLPGSHERYLRNALPNVMHLDRLCDGYLEHEQRYVYPIRDMYAATVGYVARSYLLHQERKALIRMYSEGPLTMAWYGHEHLKTDRPIVVVEDQPSAHRLGQFTPCVALLGTSISDDGIREIETFGKRVVVVLDNDATETAVKIARRFRNGTMYPLVGPDIKDMSPEVFYNLGQHLSRNH